VTRPSPSVDAINTLVDNDALSSLVDEITALWMNRESLVSLCRALVFAPGHETTLLNPYKEHKRTTMAQHQPTN
jgi:hypothetical protein